MPNQLSAFREAEGAAGQTELTTISGLKSNMWHRCMNALETNMMHEIQLFVRLCMKKSIIEGFQLYINHCLQRDVT